LEEGDIIIDGGNSEYQDTQRRTKTLAQKGLLFVGSGVSGGEEGARYGPSLMPGGNPKAWPYIKNIFQVSRVLNMFSLYLASNHIYTTSSLGPWNFLLLIYHFTYISIFILYCYTYILFL